MTRIVREGEVPQPSPSASADASDLDAGLRLGYVLHVKGALDEAADVYYPLSEAFPRSEEVWLRLGNVERGRGNVGAAIDHLRRAVQLRPAFWEARNNLGLALQQAGEAAEAVRELSEAVEFNPAHAELHFNLAVSLASLGRLEDAAGAYRRAIDIDADFAQAHNNLGATLKVLGELDSAAAAFRAAAKRAPDWAAPLSNLAGVYEWQARHDDALACHRRAMALAPDDARAHGNYLFTMLFHPRFDASKHRQELAEWNRRHAEPLRCFIRPPANDRSPERRLRIGYLGSYFADHVVGRNLLPLFREHDPKQVELICYSTNAKHDSTTDNFRALASGWRDIAELSDADAAARVREDAVDILVNTGLHMESDRLLIFARKPAPVQVAFAGYPGSTGVPAIDYRLTDGFLDPPGVDDRSDAESAWRLPSSFWCYDPLGLDVAVSPLPADASDLITFGCLNNYSKVNDRVLALWAQVLDAVTGSRLLVLSHDGSHRALALEALKWQGIEPSRVEFAAYRPREDYLRLFHRIDVSLETLPYNGHTTSLDSLWMGVPVVTLVGETLVGRAGLSQLTNLGLPELIAHDSAEFVRIASELADDRARLRDLRRTLRARMQASPLMDAKAFARDIEFAYRQMWRRWCACDASVQVLR